MYFAYEKNMNYRVQRQNAMDWIVSLQNSYVEVLTLTIALSNPNYFPSV